MPLPSFSRLVALVTAMQAAQVNQLYDEVEKIAPGVLLADYRNVETIGGSKTLTDADMPVQVLTPSGANRDVILPSAAITNHPFLISNPTGTSYALVVKSGATTLATLSAGNTVYVLSTGSAWYTPRRTDVNLVVYGASATWNKPLGLQYVVVEVVGGGGAGGGAAATDGSTYSSGGGGCGGGYARKKILASALAASEVITVGAGGAGVAGGAGNAGGTSSFGAHVSATGGAGGAVLGAFAGLGIGGAAGVGGVGVGGLLNVYGGPGAIGVRNANNTGVGGNGGNSPLGGGGTCQIVGGSGGVNGENGNFYGGGGAGSANLVSQASRAGGNGAKGVVIIWEYTEG